MKRSPVHFLSRKGVRLSPYDRLTPAEARYLFIGGPPPEGKPTANTNTPAPPAAAPGVTIHIHLDPRQFLHGKTGG